MTASHGWQRKSGNTPQSASRTFCRILGEEKGKDGKTYLILEPITAPDEDQAARKRYEAVLLRQFRGDRREQPEQPGGRLSLTHVDRDAENP